jgi:hypothetical protein
LLHYKSRGSGVLVTISGSATYRVPQYKSSR